MFFTTDSPEPSNHNCGAPVWTRRTPTPTSAKRLMIDKYHAGSSNPMRFQSRHAPTKVERHPSPRSISDANPARRLWRQSAPSVANRTTPASAVPNAAPTARENCTDPAADPSIPGGAEFWTVTCTTPMTDPMKSADDSRARLANCRTATDVSSKTIKASQEQHQVDRDQSKRRENRSTPRPAHQTARSQAIRRRSR